MRFLDAVVSLVRSYKRYKSKRAISRHAPPPPRALLSADRARALLRAGAALGARARPQAPSPLELARQLLQQQPGGGANDSAVGRKA